MSRNWKQLKKKHKKKNPAATLSGLSSSSYHVQSLEGAGLGPKKWLKGAFSYVCSTA